MKNHEGRHHDYYSVSFRIIGNDLEPSEITMLLGMKADIEHKRGDTRTGISKSGKMIKYAPFNSGLWSIESNLDKYAGIQEHIMNLIGRIESKKDVLTRLNNDGFKMDFYCGYFFSITNQAGIRLTKELLKIVAELGIDLNVDLYAI